MRSASDTSNGRHVRSAASRLLRYFLFLAILGVWIASPLLTFSAPVLAERLLWIYIFSTLALIFLFLAALFRRRWRELAVLSAIVAGSLAPFYVPSFSLRWLVVIAFRIHVS